MSQKHQLILLFTETFQDGLCPKQVETELREDDQIEIRPMTFAQVLVLKLTPRIKPDRSATSDQVLVTGLQNWDNSAI